MVFAFLIVVFITAALSAPAWLFARKRDAWFAWDYATLIAPFVVWIGLTACGYGPQSLANLIELVLLVMVIPALLSVRVFLTWVRTVPPRKGSLVVFVLSVLIAVGLRTFMPLLPE